MSVVVIVSMSRWFFLLTYGCLVFVVILFSFKTVKVPAEFLAIMTIRVSVR